MVSGWISFYFYDFLIFTRILKTGVGASHWEVLLVVDKISAKGSMASRSRHLWMPYTMTRVGFQIGGTLTRKVACTGVPILSLSPFSKRVDLASTLCCIWSQPGLWHLSSFSLGCKRIDPLCRRRSICRVIAICSLEIRGSHCAIERCPAVHTYHIYNQHWRALACTGVKGWN